MLIIGSQALRHHGIQLSRKTFDTDVICTYDEYKTWVKEHDPIEAYPLNDNKMIAKEKSGHMWEFDIAWGEGSSSDLILQKEDNDYASMNMLFLIKSSHKYAKQKFFWKTLHDYHLMKNQGAIIPKGWKPILKLREKETYNGKKTPRLNVDAKEFFNDTVEYDYIHDDIHEAIKNLAKPAYQYYMVDDAEVLSCRQKFFACDEHIRLYGALEEIEVLALERYIIKNDYKPNPVEAFQIAFYRAMLGIVGNWFRFYIYSNWPKLKEMFNPNYVDKFKLALNAGKVRPYEK